MGALTLLVTGAGGFLGGAVADCARARGHRVRTVTRRPGGDVVADLAVGLPPAATHGVNAILHCAAALTGDEGRMQRDTVQATRTVAATGLPVVLAGSVSVYDGMARVVDESTPIEPRPDLRDAYTRAKIAQEQAAPGACVLRIGALWDAGHLWNAHLGVFAGPLFLRIGRGEIPLAHVRNAALAMVMAAEGGWTWPVNVVDDIRPDAATFLRGVRQPPRLVLPVPFALVDAAARIAGGPGLLRRPTLHARLGPRRWSNARLHGLGWAPVAGFGGAP